MNKQITNPLRILLILLPVLFLSACHFLDLDLLQVAFLAWAEENEVYVNGGYKLDGLAKKSVENTVGEITNQEEFVELDGLDVIRDIEKADDLAAKALVDFDTTKMSSAVSIRPLDWRLREQEGVVWLAKDNGAAAETSFTKSDELLRESLRSGGDCFTLRRAQLETRLFTLSDAIVTRKLQNSGGPEIEALQAENRRVADELSRMNNNHQSDFCE